MEASSVYKNVKFASCPKLCIYMSGLPFFPLVSPTPCPQDIFWEVICSHICFFFSCQDVGLDSKIEEILSECNMEAEKYFRNSQSDCVVINWNTSAYLFTLKTMGSFVFSFLNVIRAVALILMARNRQGYIIVFLYFTSVELP